MCLLGLVCRITELSNPSLRKEGKMHKRREYGLAGSLDATPALEGKVVSI